MIYCYHCMTEIKSDNAVYCPECGKKYNEHFAQSNELPAGTVIGKGRYLVGKSIGSGGFGITYIGCDLNIGKKILIKETFYNGVFKRNCYDQNSTDPLSVTYDSDISLEKIMRKTRKECETLAKAEKLDNIVKVYDFFSENNTTYLITEFIEGVTLSEKVRLSGRYSWDELYAKMKPLMLSLAELHDMGILHRDIKPENIMLKAAKHSGDRFILIDFGLAHTTAHNTVVTNAVSFSPGYAPYEQRMLGGVEGAFVDVYPLAATIYYAVTGENPFQTMNDDTDENFPKLKFLSSDYGVPQNVVNALYAALKTDYKKRTPSIPEFLRGLDGGYAPEQPAASGNNGSSSQLNVNSSQVVFGSSGYMTGNNTHLSNNSMGNSVFEIEIVDNKPKKKGFVAVSVFVVLAVIVGIGFAFSGWGRNRGELSTASRSVSSNIVIKSDSDDVSKSAGSNVSASKKLTDSGDSSLYEYFGIAVSVPPDFTVDEEKDGNSVTFNPPESFDSIAITKGSSSYSSEYMTEESVNKSMSMFFDDYPGCEDFRTYEIDGCHAVRYHHTIRTGDYNFYQAQMTVYLEDYSVLVTCTCLTDEYIDVFNSMLDSIRVVQ